MHRLLQFTRFFATVAIFSSLGGGLYAADISGSHENPNEEFGKDANYKLTGDAQFGWRSGKVTGDIDLNGHSLVIETGGGNHTIFSGAISGKGSIEWRGGSVPQVRPSVLEGDKANTYEGVFTLDRGVLDLHKSPGIAAISGDLVIGIKGDAMVRVDVPGQIKAGAKITFAGPGVSSLDLGGHNLKLAKVALKTHAEIIMGDETTSLEIDEAPADSWDLTKTLTIRGYKLGNDSLSIGKNANGLTAGQLARIGFAAPKGVRRGLYTAAIDPEGRLFPRTRVAAVNPPFDVSPEAAANREKLYKIAGLEDLTGKSSPIKDGTTIDFFGDSITWLNGYIGRMNDAIARGEGTKGKKIKLVNHGINGGGVLQVRDGAKEAGYPGSSPQEPFAKLIAADKADIAVVLIGVNDVWWRNTSADVFEKAMRDLVAAAKANKTTLVLATITVHGELPNGKNGDDKKIEQYVEITRKVARETKTTLVDLRKAYIAFLQNNNAELRVDGTLYSVPSGILTYDTVHPNAEGVKLLANLLSDGIVRAIAPQK